MPGIAGIITPFPTLDDQALALEMVGSMRHSAGCDHGQLFAPECGVCAGWIAHTGSFAAKQSSVELPNSARLLWSGECFDSDGVPPVDPSTPRSLLGQHAAIGESFVSSVNGLFSGMLVDRRRRRTLLFNDRFGSERLFAHEAGGKVYFASEAKALLCVLPELRAFDELGVADFLTFGSTLEGRTLFRGLRMLPGGSLWSFDAGKPVQRTQYFLPREWERQEPLTEETFENRLASAFSRVLPRYSASELGIGVSITGGLDTRMIMACLPASSSMPCYTYAAVRGDSLDVSIGRRVAAVRGLRHYALRVSDSFAANYGHHLDRTVYVTDGSAGALGAHEIMLSEQAHALAPVRLTGNYGSEVLRSMSTFKPIGLDPALIDASWSGPIADSEARMKEREVHPVTHAAFEEIPWHLSGTLQAARSQLTVRTPYMDNEIVALAYLASEQARRSPAPSMGVIQRRAPELARLPTDRGLAWQSPAWRTLPRRLFCAGTFKLDYWDKEGLPSALSATEPLIDLLGALGLLGLHKFLPYRRWFRRECAGYIAEVVADVRNRHMPFWTSSFLASVVEDHVRGRANRLRELNAILTLEAVDRLLIGRATPAETSIDPF